MPELITSDAVSAEPSRLRAASVAGFVCLMMLSVLWPSPVIWLNELTLDLPLAIDHRSFLGREAPSWDVAFWSIAGLFALALIHGGVPGLRRTAAAMMRDLGETFASLGRRILTLPLHTVALLLLLSATLVSLTWLFVDGSLMVAAQEVRTETTRSFVRLLNRLGGGMNPAIVVGYFLVAGLATGERWWWRTSVAMAAAGLSAGLAAQLMKLLFDRSRPEMWLGPFAFTESASSSFPSGHTVGAFALAGVLIFGARSLPLRFSAFAIALAVAVSRVIGLRHWPSDVVASAICGLLLGWFFATALVRQEELAAEPEADLAGAVGVRRVA